MEEVFIAPAPRLDSSRVFYRRWLNGSVAAWVGFVFLGQLMFALYIAAQFAMPMALGVLDESQFSHMIEGYVNGDTVNNRILLLHIIPVILLSLSGTLQLFPFVRQRYPAFHRLNGRLFLTIGLMGAITGLYLTWGRGARLSDIGAIGVTLNGLLIPVAVIMAWRFAVQKKFAQHRRAAVHAFILINGVWSLRLFLMGWLMVNQGRFGNNATMDGPADLVISFACYLLPMAIAEVVFWAEKHSHPRAVATAAVAATVGAFITLVGVAAASTMMWLPRIQATF